MFNLKLNKTKTEYIRMQKKYKKSKGNNSGNNNNNNNNRRSDRIGTPRSGVNSLNSSLSEIMIDQMETHQKQKYEHEILTLKSQLNEHKLKEMELYHEKENILKQLENYKDANLVSLYKTKEYFNFFEFINLRICIEK